MNHIEVLNRLDAERRHLVRDREICQTLPQVTRMRSADGSHHWVIWSSLTEASADGTISQEIEYHRQIGAEFEWKLYAHDAPTDLLKRLERHGFDIGPCEALMVYDLSNGVKWPQDAKALKVVRIEREEQIKDFRCVAEAVFGKDYSFTSTELAEALRIGSTQHLGYIAYAGHEPVSIGRLYTHPESLFAGFYGGATMKNYRGQGFYRAVVSARAQEAIRLGTRYLTVDALPTSHPILERMGFVHLTDTWPCEWRPG